MNIEIKTENKKAIAELSVDTQVIIGLLKKCEVGQMITYASLSQAIGRNVQTAARHITESARDIVQRDYHMVFSCVLNEGLKRLDDTAIVELHRGSTARISRHAARTIRKMSCAEYERLSQSQKVQFNVGVSVLGAIGQITRRKQIATVEKRVTETMDKVAFGKMLDMFK